MLKYYSAELVSVVDVLKSGILVDELTIVRRPLDEDTSLSPPAMLKKERKVIWLELQPHNHAHSTGGGSKEVCAGTYRLCISTADQFQARRHTIRPPKCNWCPTSEDEALINGTDNICIIKGLLINHVLSIIAGLLYWIKCVYGVIRLCAVYCTVL